jgi:hypothetical protein
MKTITLLLALFLTMCAANESFNDMGKNSFVYVAISSGGVTGKIRAEFTEETMKRYNLKQGCTVDSILFRELVKSDLGLIRELIIEKQ